MVKSRSKLDATFFALSDPIRRGIVERLHEGECSVGELARPYRVSAPAISKHLRVLERAGLVRQERVGKGRRCRLVAQPLRQATEWLEHYRQAWHTQLDSFASYAEQLEKKKKKKAKR